jgi:hypothetical protein
MVMQLYKKPCRQSEKFRKKRQILLILLEFVVSEICFAKRLAQSREVAKKAQKLGVLGDFPSTAR